MNLPKVAGVLSDSSKLAFDDLDQTVSKLIHLISITDDFLNLDNWTETDADEKVNLSGGVITLDGSGSAFNTHGLYRTSGITRATGYMELKAKYGTIGITNWLQFSANNSAAIPNGNVGGQICFYGGTASTIQVYHAVSIVDTTPISADTFYTFRLYIGKSLNGTSYKFIRATIQGGAYTNETEIAKCDGTTSEVASTFYPTIARYASNPGSLTSVKEFRWYSGYATDGPYTTFTHDAGSGKTFDNFDMTDLAMPASMASTNLKFAYYFGDDPDGAISSWYTLANFNALGKITGRYRYIKVAVQNNSDGSTQAYAAKPNSDTATDGCGDFPSVANTFDNDTVQGTTGTGKAPAAGKVMADAGNFGPGAATTPTLPLNKVAPSNGGTMDLPSIGNVRDNDTLETITGTLSSDKILKSNSTPGNYNDDNLSVGNVRPVAFGLSQTGDLSNLAATDTAYDTLETTRNSGAAVGIIKSGETIVQKGTSYLGTYSGGGATAPDAPAAFSVTTRSDTKLRIWIPFTANAAWFDVYRATSELGSYSKINSSNVTATYYDDATCSAATEYWYKLKAVNTAGESAFSSAQKGTTDNADCIISMTTADMVSALQNITTANDYNTNIITVEQERIAERINDRLPMIEVCGPVVSIRRDDAAAQTGGDYYEAMYLLVYKELVNDENLSTEPATQRMDNVGADIIKALMDDHTRGGRAINTEVTDVYYNMDTMKNEIPIFCVNVEVTIKTIIDSFDPYKIG